MRNMRNRESVMRMALFVLLLSFATERQAHAYTDPGTGALIWQALVAGFVGLAYYFRRFTMKLRKKKEAKD